VLQIIVNHVLQENTRVVVLPIVYRVLLAPTQLEVLAFVLHALQVPFHQVLEPVLFRLVLLALLVAIQLEAQVLAHYALLVHMALLLEPILLVHAHLAPLEHTVQIVEQIV